MQNRATKNSRSRSFRERRARVFYRERDNSRREDSGVGGRGVRFADSKRDDKYFSRVFVRGEQRLRRLKCAKWRSRRPRPHARPRKRPFYIVFSPWRSRCQDSSPRDSQFSSRRASLRRTSSARSKSLGHPTRITVASRVRHEKQLAASQSRGRTRRHVIRETFQSVQSSDSHARAPWQDWQGVELRVADCFYFQHTRTHTVFRNTVVRSHA